MGHDFRRHLVGRRQVGSTPPQISAALELSGLATSIEVSVSPSSFSLILDHYHTASLPQISVSINRWRAYHG